MFKSLKLIGFLGFLLKEKKKKTWQMNAFVCENKEYREEVGLLVQKNSYMSIL